MSRVNCGAFKRFSSSLCLAAICLLVDDCSGQLARQWENGGDHTILKKGNGENFHGNADQTTGGFERAQLPNAVHHRYGSVRHLRISHQP
jgi:hypothetical protein